MIENKFFNNSNQTLSGKPKFMPPQKRVLLTQAPQSENSHEITNNKPPQQKTIEKIQTKPLQEEKKQNVFSFKRNCPKFQTPWGLRHERTGYLEKHMEEEEKRLFSEKFQESTQLPPDVVESSENIKVDVINQSKSEVPKIQENFEQLNLSPFLLNNVKKLGYQKLTTIQKHSIPIIQNGINLMACSQTGSGKTASFLIPIIQDLLEKGPPNPDVPLEDYKAKKRALPIALILAPTRELALQIYQESRKFSHLTGILTKVIYGGKGSYDQQKNLIDDGCDILVATPGRLIDFMDRVVDFSFLRFVVMDEADRMLDMGFEPQIRDIMTQVQVQSTYKEKIHTSMLSATFPKQMKNLVEEYLKSFIHIRIGNQGESGSVNSCIKQQLLDVRNENKPSIMFDLIGKLEGKMLIFCGTKRTVSQLYNYLNSRNLFVSQIHGDLDQEERESELSLFKTKCSILIATDVASRGLDIPDVAYVVNYDLPTNLENYVHRIGRTGRIGKLGTAISFVDFVDEPFYLKLSKFLKDSKQEIPEWFDELVEEQLAYKDERIYQSRGKKSSKFQDRGGQQGFRRNEENENGVQNIGFEKNQ